jgi:hypothetical protein
LVKLILVQLPLPLPAHPAGMAAAADAIAVAKPKNLLARVQQQLVGGVQRQVTPCSDRNMMLLLLETATA